MNKKGFTLQELLIVIALIAIGFAFFLSYFKPAVQFSKARDRNRKSDLHNLRIALEDYHTDKGCYPKPEDVCYDYATVGNPCHLCGEESGPLPNGQELPCDPSYPNKDYLYHADTDNPDCPQWYRLYTNLEWDSDPAIDEVGCYLGGCGTNPYYGYNYGTSSPNKNLEHTDSYACLNEGGDGSFYCNNCILDQCLNNRRVCPFPDKIYPSILVCNDENGL